MGKTTRWFRAFWGSKKSLNSPPATTGSDSRSAKEKEKKKWGSARSLDSNEHSVGGTRGSSAEASTSSGTYVEAADASKHAIAVAAATAAVAEAALAAAQAAAEVVRLTSGGSRPATGYVNGSGRRRELAAVKIQSAFRAYLARRALRALKGLVKLQALVRGRIVRKQSADMLRRMQAMARIQARACANRAFISEYSYDSRKSSQSLHPSLAIPKRYNHQNRAYSAKFDGSANLKKTGTKSNIKDNINLEKERTHLDSNWFDRWMEECSWNRHRDTSYKTTGPDDDKILEVDTWKPHLVSQRSNRSFQTLTHVSARNNNDQGLTTPNSLPRHLMKSQKPLNPSLSSGDVLSLKSLNYPPEGDEFTVWTSENSPQVYSAFSRPGSSSRGVGPFTPARSECSRSFFGGYPGHPNYMANTESSRAKFRSQSAPRQRVHFEKPGSTKRYVRGLWDVDTISERGLDLHDNSRTKAYPGL